MKRVGVLLLGYAFLGALASCKGIVFSPDAGRTLPRPGLCRVTSAQVATDGAPPTGTPVCSVASPTGCSCENYNGAYPSAPEQRMSVPPVPPPFTGGVDDGLATGVFDTIKSRICHNQGTPGDCATDATIQGCAADTTHGNVLFAWPDCATVAQVSGTVYEVGDFGGDDIFDPWNDDDWTVNVCPEAMWVALPGQTWIPKELRELRNFYGIGGTPGISGRLHVEMQGCRFFNGTFTLRDPGGTRSRSYDTRPQVGDLITAAGDWVFDRYHQDHDGFAAGWNEIHEGRIFATAKRSPVPADGSVSNVFVSTMFVQDSPQSDVLEIQAKIPRPTAPAPAGMEWTLTTCEKDGDFVLFNRPCSGFPTGNVMVSERSDIGACQIRVERPADLGALGISFHGYSCQVTCDSTDFRDCSQVAYVGVVRGTWALTPAPAPLPAPPEDGSAPGDLWMCDNCACGDPASTTPIAAPIVGCAVTGLDTETSGSLQQACKEACGGMVFAGRQAGVTRTCGAPAAGTTPSARLIARNACVPRVPGDLYRTTSAADFHVKLTPYNPTTGQGSFATFTWGTDQASHVPLHGDLSMNLNETFDARSHARQKILDLANLEMLADDFTLRRSVSGVTTFIGQRLWARFVDATSFTFPARSVVLGLRGLVDGVPQGINEENTAPASGTFDPVTRVFTLDIAVQDVEQGEPRTMTAHVVGTIDNLPPTAVITGAPTTLECGTAASLSGAASQDPDGQPISRFQWLIDGAPGGTQDHLAVSSKKLGRTTYDLRVYDASLGAGHTQVAVNVVDSIPPKLTIPTNVTTHICQTNGPIQVGQATATDTCATPTVVGTVVTLNGVALNPPIPVVGGQVTLGVGTYRIQWSASDGTNQVQGTQTVVVGGGIETSQSFLVDDRGVVRTTGGAPAAVLNAGTGVTSIGNDASTGSILSVGPVTVLDRAHVGSITSAGSVTVSSTAVVGGPITPFTPVTLPALPGLPTFPAAQPGFTLTAGQTRTLSPGSYGTVTLNSQSTLILAAGDYFFRDLTINAQVNVRVTATTRVFVQTTMAFRSSFKNAAGQVQAITLGFKGTVAVTLEAAFDGTLIAPSAKVFFGVDTILTFNGSFFGKTFEVRPQSTLVCL